MPEKAARAVIDKKEIRAENFIFPEAFIGVFALIAGKMGLINLWNTRMNTAYALLMDTAFYLMAICVLMGRFFWGMQWFSRVPTQNTLRHVGEEAAKLL